MSIEENRTPPHPTSQTSPPSKTQSRRIRPDIMDIIKDNPNWDKQLQAYEKAKEPIHYDESAFSPIITKKMIVQAESKFNPITQKYKDKKMDEKVSQTSRESKLNTIAKGYDKQLEVESTYDLFNLENKLKHFNFENEILSNRERYKDKDVGLNGEKIFDFEKINAKPYNIISNLNLQEHNFCPPEQRPKDNEQKIAKTTEGLTFKKKVGVIYNTNDRDFNIINNRYLRFHDEKAKTENDIQNLMAIKKMQSMKAYDIIKAKYINPDVEKEEMEKLKQKKHITKDRNFIVRNPVNDYVYDKEKQEKLDNIDKEKKMRYHLHYNVENYYHSLGNNADELRKIKEQSYFCPFEFNIHNKRGYDIINCKTNTDEDKMKHNKKILELHQDKLMTEWEKIQHKADANKSTFNTKGIYKPAYDCTDVNSNYWKFLNNRRNYLEKYPPSQSLNTEGNGKRDRTPKQGNNNTNGNDKFMYKSVDYANRGRNSETNIRLNKNICNTFNDMNNRVNYQVQYGNIDKEKFFY